jgi:hypothetical protein
VTIVNRTSSFVRTALVIIGLLAPVAPANASEDLVINAAVPPAGELGIYTGAIKIGLGSIHDEVHAEGPARIGTGPEATYKVEVAGSRADFVKQGLGEAFRRIGLLADDPVSSGHVVDIRILRDRLHAHQTGGRFRLRTELFLHCTFRQGEAVEGRVLACGNAETYAQFASREKITQTYQIAFNDAVHKILNSQSLAHVLGGGLKPAPAPEKSGEHDTTRIHKDEFYGPTDAIREEAEKASKAIRDAGPFTHLVLPDFQIEELKGKEKDELHDVRAARALVPEKIREHLNAFYPGAFESIERVGTAGGVGRLVVDGRLEKFRIGSYAARIWVGAGAGKDKLEGQISIQDGSGRTLAGFPILTSNWGAWWQFKQGQIRDMVDQLARDMAYFLVRTAIPDYKPPEDLEILFDATSYPTKQKKP